MLTFKLMETAPKITLSDKELELVCNTDWILTKHAVVQKVYALFGEVLPRLQNTVNTHQRHLPEAVLASSAKISKGENYKLLPYVILDYPRCFAKEDTMAVRTFFWWGNFFSVTLQLSGTYKINAEKKVLQSYQWLKEEGFSVCVNEQPWEHDFETTNFVQVSSLTKEAFSDIQRRKPFIKIAKNIGLKNWGSAPAFIEIVFTQLIGLVKMD